MLYISVTPSLLHYCWVGSSLRPLPPAVSSKQYKDAPLLLPHLYKISNTPTMSTSKPKGSPQWPPDKVFRPGKVKAIAKSTIRSSIHAVDTNLSSYERTDPFTAFNALLRLIGSLSSRLGSCAYKMSPDEHALSMHLLTIVEPFVGTAPSRRTLTRQPTEILDAIATCIDSRKDLISLALTCKRMHGVVCPRHTDYRVIRAKLSAVRVWNHLIVHRSLASNVRVLEVLDERCSTSAVTPKDIVARDTDLETTDDELGMHAKQERTLVAAIGRMSGLQSFTWSCNHSPISIDDLWPTLLTKCPALCELDIRDNLVFSKYENNETSKHPKILTGLKSVAVHSTKHTYGMAKSPELARIAQMINHAPNLESLDIRFHPQRPSAPVPSPRADNLLLLARLPRLTSLTLTNLALGSNEPPASFITAHPQLEVLHLDLRMSAGKFYLPDGSLPFLRELTANTDVATAILGAAGADGGRLETLRGVALRGSPMDALFLNNLRLGGCHLRRLELAQGGWAEVEDVARLVSCVPNLRWLEVGASRRPMAKNAGPTTNVVEWSQALSVLPELTALHGIKFFYEMSSMALTAYATTHNTAHSTGPSGIMFHVNDRNAPVLGPSDRSRLRKNEEVAHALGRRCPKLRRLDHWEDHTGRIIVLHRDGQGDKAKIAWEVRRVKA